MAGDNADKFEVVISVMDDNSGAPPLVNGAYNYYTGDFFAQLDEVDWSKGIPELAKEVDEKAEKESENNKELVDDDIEREGLSRDNPDDEYKIEELEQQYEGFWMFNVIVHCEPDEHNHFYGHTGIGAELQAPFYLKVGCGWGYEEERIGSKEEEDTEKEEFFAEFKKALKKVALGESRHRRGRMLRESIPPKKAFRGYMERTRIYKKRYELVQKAKMIDAIELKDYEEYQRIHHEVWLAPMAISMDINGNATGAIWYGEKDKNYYYTTSIGVLQMAV